MDAKQYERISAPFRRHPASVRILAGANRLLTGMFYLLYPALLTWMLLDCSPLVLACVLVPGVSFVLVSVFRKCFDAARPYELLSIEPLISKDTKGQSFPSRHVFSATVISMCWFAWEPRVACVLFAAVVVMAAIRVVGGVHFVKDVVAGAAIGVVFGMLVVIWPFS